MRGRQVLLVSSQSLHGLTNFQNIYAIKHFYGKYLNERWLPRINLQNSLLNFLNLFRFYWRNQQEVQRCCWFHTDSYVVWQICKYLCKQAFLWKKFDWKMVALYQFTNFIENFLNFFSFTGDISNKCTDVLCSWVAEYREIFIQLAGWLNLRNVKCTEVAHWFHTWSHPLSHSCLKQPKTVWQFWWYPSKESFFQKIFEGEILTRIRPTTLLQIFHELTLPMLGLLLSNRQLREDFWKPSKPCHVCIHWVALT